MILPADIKVASDLAWLRANERGAEIRRQLKAGEITRGQVLDYIHRLKERASK